jgi:hypothetical protein
MISLFRDFPEEGATSPAPDLMDYARSTLEVVNGVEVAMGPSLPTLKYGGLAPKDMPWVMERLTPTPWWGFTQRLRLANGPAVGRIPFTNINTTASRDFRSAEDARRAHEGERVWEVDTGHDLMLTEPEKTAELLLRVAAL